MYRNTFRKPSMVDSQLKSNEFRKIITKCIWYLDNAFSSHISYLIDEITQSISKNIGFLAHLGKRNPGIKISLEYLKKTIFMGMENACIRNIRYFVSNITNPFCPIMIFTYTHLRAHETRHDLVCRL